jgi:hypothetical protein
MNNPSEAAGHELPNIAEKETWMLNLFGAESQQPFGYGL